MEIKFKHDASQHAIESVTIYRDGGAKVHRTTNLTCKRGTYEARIINLPSCIQKDSVHVQLDQNECISLRKFSYDNNHILRGQINKLNVACYKSKEEKKLIESKITERESRLGSSVTVCFEAVADGEATFSLTYLVKNVSFKPFYDIQIPLELRVGYSEMNTMRAIYQASLEQSTGEDWKNVILEASSFYLTGNVVTPGNSRARVAPSSHGDSNLRQREEVITRLGQYTIGHKTTTQGTQNIFIANLNFTEVDIEYGLVPDHDMGRIYQAYITNTSSHFLFKGSVNFMLNGRLVGMTTIPDSHKGQKFVCSLSKIQHLLCITEAMRPSVAPSVREHWGRARTKHSVRSNIQRFAKRWVSTSDKSPESVPPSDPTRGRYKQKGGGMAISEEAIGSLSPNGFFERTIGINPGETLELQMGYSIPTPS